MPFQTALYCYPKTIFLLQHLCHQQPMERTGSGQQRGFTNMLTKVFSLLMHKMTNESGIDSFWLKHCLVAPQKTWPVS